MHCCSQLPMQTPKRLLHQALPRAHQRESTEELRTCGAHNLRRPTVLSSDSALHERPRRLERRARIQRSGPTQTGADLLTGAFAPKARIATESGTGHQARYTDAVDLRPYLCIGCSSQPAHLRDRARTPSQLRKRTRATRARQSSFRKAVREKNWRVRCLMSDSLRHCSLGHFRGRVRRSPSMRVGNGPSVLEMTLCAATYTRSSGPSLSAG